MFLGIDFGLFLLIELSVCLGTFGSLSFVSHFEDGDQHRKELLCRLLRRQLRVIEIKLTEHTNYANTANRLKWKTCPLLRIRRAIPVPLRQSLLRTLIVS